MADRELYAEITKLKADKAKLNRMITDGKYFIEALVNMLGPKGFEVWKSWENATRVHYSWGPDAGALTGEERAEVILTLNEALKDPTKCREMLPGEIDGDFPTTDFQDGLPPRTKRKQISIKELVKQFEEKPDDNQTT